MTHLDPEAELLILNGNEFLDIDYEATIAGFRARGLDAGVVAFASIHPRYSYVLLDEDELVIQAAEKNPISRHAIAGFYWFRCAGDFIAGAQAMIRKDAHEDGKFFISPAFNELVLLGRKIGIQHVDSKQYHPLKSRRQISVYEADFSGDAT
jgi:dTDP-glucose pyrophosphorylase